MAGCSDIGGCGRRREANEGVGLVQLKGSTSWVCYMCYVMPVWIARDNERRDRLAEEKRQREEAAGVTKKTTRKRAA
jgi:hypothetical protein